jgi:hypothetical protein
MSDDLRPSAATDSVALDGFFRHVRAVNPFLDNRVNAPSPDDVDVGTIHHAAFVRLTQLAAEALAAQRGIGVVLWGQAGIGKSHLLSRLGRWAARDGRACFVYLHNLQAAPDFLPRSLLHAVVSLLTQGRQRRFELTPLFELARGAVLEAVGGAGKPIPWPEIQSAYSAWVDRLAAPAVPGGGWVDRTVYDVLYRFFRSAFRAARGKEDGREAALAVRWLCGVALDPEEARVLGLPRGRHAEEPAALADAEQIKHVLVALSRLAACRGQPFLLVFDQVDNLDDDQVGALSRFLQALLDSSHNLLAVAAGIQTTLVPWHEKGIITDSAWDRIAQFRILLNRLSPAEALAIVQARLDASLAPYAALEPVCRMRQSDALFPLGAGWMQEHVGERDEVRPRDALNAAREGWRRQQETLSRIGGPAWLERWPGELVAGPEPAPLEAVIDRAVEEKIREHVEQCLRVPGSLPPDADHLAGLLFALLEQCRDAEHYCGLQEVDRLPPPRRGARPIYDLAVTQRLQGRGLPVRTGVVAVTAPSAVSVSGFLRRLVEDPRPLDRVVLVTDERVGLPLGERGEHYLGELRRSGPERFRTVELSLRQYAELEALLKPVLLARSADLEVQIPPGPSRVVQEREVIASHRRRGRYAACRVLQEVLAAVAETAATPAAADLNGSPREKTMEE